MSDPITIESPITSSTDFETALAAVVESAIRGDVNVQGAWEFETGGSTHRWELNVVELADPDDGDQD